MSWKHAITSGEFSKYSKLGVSIAISRNVIELRGIKRNLYKLYLYKLYKFKKEIIIIRTHACKPIQILKFLTLIYWCIVNYDLYYCVITENWSAEGRRQSTTVQLAGMSAVT